MDKEYSIQKFQIHSKLRDMHQPLTCKIVRGKGNKERPAVPPSEWPDVPPTRSDLLENSSTSTKTYPKDVTNGASCLQDEIDE